MNYIVTGIGKSQDAIFKELLNRKFAVKKIDYSEVTDNSEDLFLSSMMVQNLIYVRSF